MRVICSYCRASLGEKPPLDRDEVSHGMCRECASYFERQWNGLSLGEYLDRFEFPVLVVNEELRVVAANGAMAAMIGREQREVFGLLGGEAAECVHARLPEGCGSTIHCSTCTLRMCVTWTAETGRSIHRVESYLERDRGRENFFVSTVKLGRSVQVLMEPAPAGPPAGDDPGASEES